MFEFLLSDANFIYSTAIAIVLALALLEGLGVLIGLSLLAALDNLFDLNVELDAEAEVSTGGLTSLLGWLCLDKLPLLVWLIIVLTSFGVAGILFNQLLPNISWFTPTWVLLASLVCTVFISHYLGNIIARLFPKNESSAIHSTDFAGQIATITIGTATKGKAAEAVFQDQYQQKHYVMVEPEQDNIALPQGTQVLLLEKRQTVWLVNEFTSTY